MRCLDGVKPVSLSPSRHQVSAAAHELVSHANPLSSAQMAELVAWATRWHPSTAIDIGCGPGSFSIGLAARAPVNVLAIDLNPWFLERARISAQATSLVGSVEFVERQLRDDECDRFDVVVCIGSSGAIGAPREALRRCKQLLTEGGVVVFADLVWRMKPPPEFLSFLGVDEDFYWSHSDGESILEQCGLAVVYQCEASEGSWSNYENAVLTGRLQYAARLDADARAALCNRATTWFAMHEQYGRACLGFNAYVARHAGAFEPLGLQNDNALCESKSTTFLVKPFMRS